MLFLADMFSVATQSAEIRRSARATVSQKPPAKTFILGNSTFLLQTKLRSESNLPK